MKKKFMSLLLIMSFVVLLETPVGAVNQVQSNTLEGMEATATIFSSETKEEQEVNISPKSITILSVSPDGEETIDVGYSATIMLEYPQTRADTGKVTTGAGVTANLHVVYTISSNKEQINITKVYGNWIPGKSYVISNREVGVTNNGASIIKPPRLLKNPTTNTFSYDINWGYQNFVTGTVSAPYAWSEAKSQVPGMGGYYTITVEFNFPDHR